MSQPRLSSAVAPALGVALTSAATLTLELTLIRLFSIAQFTHFAFMAVSLALLGAGASGSLLAVWPRLGRRPALLALLFALSVPGSYLIFNTVPFDSYSIAWDRRQVAFLAAYFASAGLPFLFGGLVIGGQLAADASRAHRTYAANLLGSAAGCALALPALAALGGEGTLLLAAGLAASSGAAFSWRRRFPALALTGLAALGVWAAYSPPALFAQRLSPRKDLALALHAPDAEHALTAWNAIARLDVVESSSVHIVPGLSLNSPAGPPPQIGVTLDGDNLLPISGVPVDEAEAFAPYLPLAAAYELRPGAETLVVEPGGGLDVLAALADGAEHVTGVADNPLLLRLVRDDYGAFTDGLYNDSRVTLVEEGGRAFLRGPGPAYEVIDFALTDSFRPVTSGAYSLSENYAYTSEAFADALDRLDESGLLVVTRWTQSPPTETVRTLGAAIVALERRGVTKPGEQVMAFRTLRTLTLLVGEQPFTADEADTIQEFAAERFYDVVWVPGMAAEEANRFSVLPEPVYYNAFRELLEATPEERTAFYAGYEFDVRPATDNRPFFFHYFKWRQTPEVLAALGRTSQPFGGSGYFVLLALLALVTVAAAVLIVAPVALERHWRRAEERREYGGTGRVLVYFLALGLGFLFVEIPLAQRFILLVGRPVTALTVVLFALLLFSGVGSYLSPRLPLPYVLAALVALIAVYPSLTTLLLRGALGAPLGARAALATLVLGPLGLAMGVPFAAGLALVERQRPGLTAWAWAINGSASVISAVLAVVLAMGWGFSAVLWLGAAAYGLALVAVWPLWRASILPPS
jgi:hypothetical protein